MICSSAKSASVPDEKTERNERIECGDGKRKSRGGLMRMLRAVMWGQRTTDSIPSDNKTILDSSAKPNAGFQ